MTNTILGVGLLILLNILLINLFFKAAIRWKIVDTPNERSSHRSLTIRGGGILFPISWFTFSLINGLALPYATLGLLLISVISFLDDFSPKKPLVRLVVHTLAFILLFSEFDLFAKMSLFWILCGLVLCIGILNAVNFMDGINGITVLYFTAFLVPIAFSLSYGMGRDFDLLSIKSPFIYLASSLLVFGYYNLRKKARTFAGDVGSVSIGYLMIMFIIFYGFDGSLSETGFEVHRWDYNYASIFFLALYGVDSIITIVERILRKENIFKAHRSHLYQLLTNELGIGHLKIALLYFLVQLSINTAIIYYEPPLWHLVAGTLVLVVLYLLVKSGVRNRIKQTQ